MAILSPVREIKFPVTRSDRWGSNANWLYPGFDVLSHFFLQQVSSYLLPVPLLAPRGVFLEKEDKARSCVNRRKERLRSYE
jgi:hypothetical protein